MDLSDIKDLKPEDITMGGDAPVETPVENNPAPVEDNSQPVEETPAAVDSNEQPDNTDRAPVETTASDEPATTEQPVSEGNERSVPDVASLTSGEFERVEDLYQRYKELSEKPQEAQYKDDFIKGVVDYYEKTGDLTPYLEAKTIDYDSLSPEELHRRSLRKEYPSLPSSHFDRLFRKKMNEKYNLSEDVDDEDRELGEILMKQDAEKLRSQWKEEQSNFKAPESQPQPDHESIIKEWRQQVEQDPQVRNFKEKPKFTVKYGDKEFTLEAEDPKGLIDAAVDNNKLFQNFVEGDPKNPRINYDKFFRVAMYAKDPQKVEKMLVDFGKQMARDEVMNELENPVHTETPNNVNTKSAPTGDWRDEFLNAALNQR